MFETNFSRISELFFREVGEKYDELSLKGMIRFAFKKYETAYLRAFSNGPIKRAFYASDDQTALLLLDVISSNRLPDLTALEIKAIDIDFSSVMKSLRGNLTAEFAGLEVSDIKKIIGEETNLSQKDNYTQIGLLGLYFSPDPKRKNVVQRAILNTGEKDDASLKPRKLFLEKTAIDDSMIKILSEASRIVVSNSLPLGGNGIQVERPQGIRSAFRSLYNLVHNYDPDKSPGGVIQELSRITQPEQGKYDLDYRIWVTSKEGMPESIIPRLEEFFSKVSNRFTKKTFKGMKLKDPAEIYDSGEERKI